MKTLFTLFLLMLSFNASAEGWFSRSYNDLGYYTSAGYSLVSIQMSGGEIWYFLQKASTIVVCVGEGMGSSDSGGTCFELR